MGELQNPILTPQRRFETFSNIQRSYFTRN